MGKRQETNSAFTLGTDFSNTVLKRETSTSIGFHAQSRWLLWCCPRILTRLYSNLSDTHFYLPALPGDQCQLTHSTQLLQQIICCCPFETVDSNGQRTAFHCSPCPPQWLYPGNRQCSPSFSTVSSQSLHWTQKTKIFYLAKWKAHTWWSNQFLLFQRWKMKLNCSKIVHLLIF